MPRKRAAAKRKAEVDENRSGKQARTAGGRAAGSTTVPTCDTTDEGEGKEEVYQVSWPSIWETYGKSVATHAEETGLLSQHNVVNGIYDLVSSATKSGAEELVNKWKDISPSDAMLAAKQAYDALSGDDRAACQTKRWRWSPQSTITRKYLGIKYGDGVSSTTTDGVPDLPGPVKAFAAGWRWLPVPDFKKSSHLMRWYAPTVLQSTLEEAGITFKNCKLIKKSGLKYLTSPQVTKWCQSAAGGSIVLPPAAEAKQTTKKKKKKKKKSIAKESSSDDEEPGADKEKEKKLKKKKTDLATSTSSQLTFTAFTERDGETFQSHYKRKKTKAVAPSPAAKPQLVSPTV